VVPAINLETAFWLESDRMLSLSFDQKVLDVQKGVVCEEFKERYFSQPYGMSWLKLRPLAYKKHPYQWATIGKELSHIENATMEDVKDFFYKFYRPNNAIMVVAGGVKTKEVKALAEKWFGPIPSGEIADKTMPQEPQQTEARLDIYEDEVPFNAIYKAYHMCSRTHPDYHATDMISDVLSLGDSNRLTQALVKDKRLFSNIDAYIMGSQDDGLFMIEGQLLEGISFEEAEAGIQEEVNKIKQDLVSDEELEKIKNKIETHEQLGTTSILNKAMELAFFENLGDANWFNQEGDKYRAVQKEDIHRLANEILREENCSTLHYKAKEK
jgi:predicted Zn-dependent peptidase